MSLPGAAASASPAGVTSSGVAARLRQGTLDIQGTAGYAGDQLKGSVTLVATDAATAQEITRKPPRGGGLPGQEGAGTAGAGPGAAVTPASAKPGPRALCGWGELDFSFTEWLTGRALVVVNSQGEATVQGEIAPPKEIILFEQKEVNRNLVKVEARALYGVPVVGNVFVFANVGLEALASIGPGKLYDIKLSGQYSTDKRVDKELSLQASLNIPAFAGLRLRAEGGAGVELLDHDLKFGVGVWALAGVRGYVEATPTIGYRQKAGAPGEFYFKGHMELAAQPFLGLGGDLFVEVDSPMWSPLPDEKWTWPLGSMEYPLPGEFGLGADVEHVLGSKQWPEIQFTEVEFDSSKFMMDLLSGEAPGRSKGGEEKRPAKWNDGGAPSAPAGAKKPPGASAPAGKGGPTTRKGAATPASAPVGGSKRGSTQKPAKAGGKPGQENKGGQEPEFSGPIGESVSFSDGQHGHRLWLDQKGSHVDLMVASDPMTVEQRLSGWDAALGQLPGKQQPNAKVLLGRARTLLQKVDKQAAALALQKADAAAKQHFAHQGKKVPGSKPPKARQPQQMNQEVKSDEHKLADTLAALFRLFGEKKVRFNPLTQAAPMMGGSERLWIREEAEAARLEARGESLGATLLSIASYLRPVRNPAGRDTVLRAFNVIRPLEKELQNIPIKNGMIDPKQNELLKVRLGTAATEVSQLGAVMKIGTLPRAKQTRPIETKVITFKFHDLPHPYKENLKAEVERQLRGQQDGLNVLNVDTWVANINTYKAYKFDNIIKLKDDAKQAVVAEIMERANKKLLDAQQERALVQAALAADRQKLADAQVNLDAAKKDLANARKLEQSKRAAARADARARRDAAKQEIKKAESSINAGEKQSAKLGEQITTSSTALSRLGVDVSDVTVLKGAIESDEVQLFTRRYENIDEWKARHAAAIKAIESDMTYLQRWEGIIDMLNAALPLLHEPDQVVGGKGLFDVDAIPTVPEPEPGASPDHHARWAHYVAQVRQHLGPQYVNQRIGGIAGTGEERDGWPIHLEELKTHVIGPGDKPEDHRYPPAAYFLWRMSVSLQHKIVRPVGR